MLKTDIMHNRKSTYSNSSSLSPSIFIQDLDYTNSHLLRKLDTFRDWEYHIIKRYEHRYDLLAQEIYGESDYQWLLQYMNKLSNDKLVRGVQLRYISKDNLLKIINSL